MARMPRIVWDFGLYHITTRGNNQQQVFHEERDFNKYLHFLQYYKEKFKFKLYAFVLMLNHPHLLVETTKSGSISAIMKLLSQRYSVFYNKKYKRIGHLWESRFHSNIVEKESYLLECMRYIELNPIRSNLVADLKNYKWSSYLAHIGDTPCTFLDTHPIFSELGKTLKEAQTNYKKFVHEGMGTDTSIQKVSVPNLC